MSLASECNFALLQDTLNKALSSSDYVIDAAWKRALDAFSANPSEKTAKALADLGNTDIVENMMKACGPGGELYEHNQLMREMGSPLAK